MVVKSNSFTENWINRPSINKKIYRNGNNNENDVLVNTYQYSWDNFIVKVLCCTVTKNPTIIIVIHSATSYFKQRVYLRSTFLQTVWISIQQFQVKFSAAIKSHSLGFNYVSRFDNCNISIKTKDTLFPTNDIR
ncbi:hypothetical protein LOAG_12241 [Loa loa]|uniref:Uncharacterized protein n=1 Tax=Loa loa TaxID=7209 RepID=A0A1S0TM26_LOALO|nr:hypothetical protein LOAG_12241 [Loa loa]EFO16264.1 hypothetical protein LOAG_12241 [Loa loa]